MQDFKKRFNKIYDEKVERIYRFIFLKVNSQDVAQDLTSEAFLRLWDILNRDPNLEIENPNAFLYQISRNLIIDHYRQKGQFQLVSTDSVEINDPRMNLEKSAFLDSDVQRIQKAIEGLKEEYQDVIIWYYLDELSIPEIAKILNKSENNVRVTIHRALNSLREKLS